MSKREKMKCEKVKKLTVGAVISDPGSTERNKTGGWRVERPEIDQSKCIKCGTCWSVCPDAAVYKDKEGKFRINYAFCKGCLICLNECPVKCISKKLEEK